MEKFTQETAAAMAGMSERTARKWQKGPLPSQSRAERDWRTRPDAFAEVWDSEVVPLLHRDSEGVLEAPTLLEEMEARHPGQVRTGEAADAPEAAARLASHGGPGAGGDLPAGARAWA